jgi:hypothetical protein
MKGADPSAAAPAGEEPFSLAHAISEELTRVPVQKTALHPEKIVPDMEGMESLNSLPSVGLSGAGSGGKWEDEDGVVRSGKFCFSFPPPIFLISLLSSNFPWYDATFGIYTHI